MTGATMPATVPAGALGLSVLVLNRSFVAVHITNVRRAITLLFRQLAEVVHRGGAIRGPFARIVA